MNNLFQYKKPIYLMDICTISVIKDRNNIPNRTDKKKKDRLSQLTELAKSKNYRFSFLLAIIEKATDHTNQLKVGAANREFQNDYDQVVNFLGRENIVENKKLLKILVNSIYDSKYDLSERGELSIVPSLNLLSYYNELNITDTPSKKERLPLVEQIVAKGDELKLEKGYPTTIMCVAALYGCIDAVKVLKLKKGGKDFNPSNRLGDIMSFYRFARAKLKVKEKYKNVPVLFRTEDEHLERMHQYITTEARVTSSGDIHMTTSILAPEKLFPNLYKNDVCIDENEKKKLFEMLSFKI
ncbi:hypothetical protein ABN239_09800 [Providencia vermicola]|uniref:hypothetical protein n=1 Tax=Providencia vermicola TaxID=333965 RepID=UPI0032DA1449